MKDAPINLRYSVPEDMRAQRLKEVQRTETFLTFIENRSFDEQKLLFAEIDKIMEEGIPFEEYVLVGMGYENMDGETDYRKIAVFCFAQTMTEVIMKNRERAKSLAETPLFTETYNDVFNQIVGYINKDRPDFPREALRCLFLLTDEYIDKHRQGLTAARLIIESFAFCSSEEQRAEIERLVKECEIPTD